MIMRDIYCLECGYVTEDYLSNVEHCDKIPAYCDGCGGTTNHAACCNGGIKARYRFADLPTDPEYYRGQVKALDVTATDSDGNPVVRYNSETKQKGPRLDEGFRNGSDKREIRRDKIQHATRRKRGTVPLTFDQGKK